MRAPSLPALDLKLLSLDYKPRILGPTFLIYVLKWSFHVDGPLFATPITRPLRERKMTIFSTA